MIDPLVDLPIPADKCFDRLDPNSKNYESFIGMRAYVRYSTKYEFIGIIEGVDKYRSRYRYRLDSHQRLNFFHLYILKDGVSPGYDIINKESTWNLLKKSYRIPIAKKWDKALNHALGCSDIDYIDSAVKVNKNPNVSQEQIAAIKEGIKRSNKKPVAKDVERWKRNLSIAKTKNSPKPNKPKKAPKEPVPKPEKTKRLTKREIQSAQSKITDKRSFSNEKKKYFSELAKKQGRKPPSQKGRKRTPEQIARQKASRAITLQRKRLEKALQKEYGRPIPRKPIAGGCHEYDRSKNVREMQEILAVMERNRET